VGLTATPSPQAEAIFGAMIDPGEGSAWVDCYAFGSDSYVRIRTNGQERTRVQPGNSASMPTLALGGDTDTGIWQSAADNLDFSTGGTNRLNISDTAFAVKNLFAPGDISDLDIDGGAITPTCSRHRVDTEGHAASDDLTTINCNVEGAILILSSTTFSRVVTLKDGVGNLRLAGDFALSNSDCIITLVYNYGLWREISRSAN